MRTLTINIGEIGIKFRLIDNENHAITPNTIVI